MAGGQEIPNARHDDDEQGGHPRSKRRQRELIFRRDGFRRLRERRLGRFPNFKRIDPDRLGDVLELHRAEIADLKIEPPFHLTIGVLGEADRPGLGDALQPRGDIDAVAHEVAVAFLDHVAEMDADPKFDALVGRDLSVALDHRSLDFNGAFHRVDDTPELDNRAIAGALDDPSVVHGDDRVDQVAAQRPEPRQNPVLVGPGKPRIADHVRAKDRSQFSGLAHGAMPPRLAAEEGDVKLSAMTKRLRASSKLTRIVATLGDIGGSYLAIRSATGVVRLAQAAAAANRGVASAASPVRRWS